MRRATRSMRVRLNSESHALLQVVRLIVRVRVSLRKECPLCGNSFSGPIRRARCSMLPSQTSSSTCPEGVRTGSFMSSKVIWCGCGVLLRASESIDRPSTIAAAMSRVNRTPRPVYLASFRAWYGSQVSTRGAVPSLHPRSPSMTRNEANLMRQT